MATHVLYQDDLTVCIPNWVRDLAGFRRWARSEEFPQRGEFAFLDGELWVDLSMERMGHNQVKGEIARVLSNLVIENPAGRFFHDRMLLTNVEAGLGAEPDGMYLSYAALQAGLVRLEQGEDSVEVEGSPDMMMEVISPASEQKDTVVLRELYWKAGVREYWLADPRGENVSLEILRRGANGFTPTRARAGWIKSLIFNKSFRLTRQLDPLGYPAYTLAAR